MPLKRGSYNLISKDDDELGAVKTHHLTPGYRRVITDDDREHNEVSTLSTYDFTISTPMSNKSADKPSQRHIRQSLSPVPPRPSLVSQSSNESQQQQQMLSTPVAINLAPAGSDVDDFLNSPIPDGEWLSLLERVENINIEN